jgi:hypothetical protein
MARTASKPADSRAASTKPANARPANAGLTKPRLKTFHATMVVTRTEEWCVEAGDAEEARALLAAGQGYRCQIGDRVHLEVEALHDQA